MSTLPDAGPLADDLRSDYRELKTAGIDTVNEIVIRKLALTGSGAVNPDLAVQLTATQARLVSVEDNRELFSRSYACSSKREKFEAWAARNAHKSGTRSSGVMTISPSAP